MLCTKSVTVTTGLVLTLWLVCVRSSTVHLYVSPTGSDSNSGSVLKFFIRPPCSMVMKNKVVNFTFNSGNYTNVTLMTMTMTMTMMMMMMMMMVVVVVVVVMMMVVVMVMMIMMSKYLGVYILTYIITTHMISHHRHHHNTCGLCLMGKGIKINKI